MINLDYKDGRTIHEQIEAQLKTLIVSGALKAGEQLPSVRELSVSLTVNPNTVQRAYKQLEQDGFIYSVKGKGNFVSQISMVNNEKRCEELFKELEGVVKELRFLKREKEDVIVVVDKVYSEKGEKQ